MQSTPLPLWRRALYLLALAQLPFTTLMGLMLVATGLPDVSVFALIGASSVFFIGCVAASLPAWFSLRMSRHASWWKGALIPGSIITLMLFGIRNYHQRRMTGIEVEIGAILQMGALMLVVLGIPGALIGAHMARAQRAAARA